MSFTGQLFMYLLVGVLFISPILRIKYKPIQRKRLWFLKLRRWLGVTSGLVGFSHFLYFLFVYTDSLSHLVNSLFTWWGLLGLILVLLLLPLTLTSNNYSVRKLKTKWKKIHTLTYLLPVLVVLHALTALKGWPIQLYVGWIVLFAALLLWRLKSLRYVTSISLPIILIGLIWSGGNESTRDINSFTNQQVSDGHSPVIRLADIDTSHPDYNTIWWNEAYTSRFNFLPDIKYSERAIAWCAETDAYPISIGEKPLYCSDGRSGTWKE